LEYALENLDQLAYLTAQHLALFGFSMLAALLLGLGIGIFVTRPGGDPRLGRIALSLTGALQAVPPVAVIALAFLFAGIGAAPAILALALYSVAPIAFNTTSGLMSIPDALSQAARGLGFTNRQILARIQLPLAIPAIMAGLRSAATINIGTATIASVIGGGGLGDVIFMGLKLYRADMILTGAGACALLALGADGLLALAEQKLRPRSTRSA